MGEVIIKATVTPDHKLAIDVPEDVPVGEVVLVIRPAAQRGEGNSERLAAAIRKAHGTAKPGRSREQIDAELAAFRDEWE